MKHPVEGFSAGEYLYSMSTSSFAAMSLCGVCLCAFDLSKADTAALICAESSLHQAFNLSLGGSNILLTVGVLHRQNR